MFHFAKDPKASFEEKLRLEMEGMRATHVPGSPGWNWFLNQPILKKDDSTCEIEDLSGKKRTLVDFTTNNYLGFSCHEEVIKAGKEALNVYGAGVCSSRLLGGHTKQTEHLEAKIAMFLKREAALVYSSSYAVNLGIFGKFLGKDDVVLSDQLNHASLIDGIRMSSAKRLIYKHLDMDNLEQMLESVKDSNIKMIVTDGVFSMDGEYCPLPRIKQLAEKFGAVIFLDDCHGFGVSGTTGKGTEEHYGMEGCADILVGTLGKAFGGMGGIVAGSRDFIDLLARTSRTFVFSTSLTPATVGTSIKALDLLIENPSILTKLRSNTKLFREGMKTLGYEVKGTDHPCCPVMIRDDIKTWKVSDYLYQHGVLASWIVVPVCAPGQQKLRIIIKASHTEGQIEKLLDLFKLALDIE